MDKIIIIKLTIYIRANSAESGPPLGTTLGNIGVNTIKFCKEFNEFTQDLPNYFLLKVNIVVSENKSYIFNVQLPSVGFFISLLKKEESIKDLNGSISINNYIILEDLLKLAKFILPTYALEKSSKILMGSLLSSNIIIKNNE
jgi:large subunit ribosomal protein L11